ncbi:carotenoid oxygenase family protein [Aspergillus clavatus NRRL 1]|uniref:Dioxygenase, putative n=1 Tax=Aspergillus clavatus (strain ATCC 1007 / CBS 513.65 / DSM 816 / NCTC 3887 / NRRL 1 / QM 1276 / 107) TaxID=344612 RepID=A1C7A1_ASPCL|nr:dioxygenase, putative [Aspergillus clavatus NRRL 1]EAW14272.1 dioxygenase, putative [Aspergillus clavatus NRRL 1]
MGSVQEYFNDWPNDIGFDANYEERQPVEVSVTGEIPSYAAGVLYRTGLGKSTVKTDVGETFEVSHWFDGFSQTHRFQILAPDESHPSTRVLYNSRFSTDELIEHIRKTGSMDKLSFAQKRDPCKTVFQKVQSTYIPENEPSYHNIGVTLSVNMPGLGDKTDVRWTGASGIKTLYAKTDSSNYKRIDPETLEPIGLAVQSNLHPDLTGPLSASHARSDPVTGDVYNFNLGFGPEGSTYRVFRVSASTGATSILATFAGTPAYLHSLFITEDYVLLCVWNSHVNPANFKASFLEAIQPFDASKPATWYVVDRKGSQGLIATYESRPFFSFHTINAWQEPCAQDPTKSDIVAELIIFDDLSILDKLYFKNMISSSASAKACVQGKRDGCRSMLASFRLPDVPAAPASEVKKATVDWTACNSLAPELPTINPNYTTQKHRYTYSVTDRDESTFFDGIMKFDSVAKETLLWKEHGHSPGEAIFVADPAGLNEDDGVLLSVVLDGREGKSYLLCLDARSMTELGRAQLNGPVGFGFHGQHIPASGGLPTGDY